jgi:hypothetical protein
MSEMKCWCHTCHPLGVDRMEMVLCPDCGNKRCPKANNHEYACSGSNDTDQPGSAYSNIPYVETFARVADALTDSKEAADALHTEYERRRIDGVPGVDGETKGKK